MPFSLPLYRCKSAGAPTCIATASAVSVPRVAADRGGHDLKPLVERRRDPHHRTVPAPSGSEFPAIIEMHVRGPESTQLLHRSGLGALQFGGAADPVTDALGQLRRH